MKTFNSNSNNSDEWLTPPAILAALGPFDLDPAAPVVRPWDMAARHYTKRDDGMAQPWEGRIWLNPPYGRETFRWLARLAAHDGGGLALIFARTETVGFHEQNGPRPAPSFSFRAVYASTTSPARREARPMRQAAWCHTLFLTLPGSSRPMQTAY